MKFLKKEIQIPEPIDYAALSEAYRSEKWSWHQQGIPSPESIKATVNWCKQQADLHNNYCATGGITVYNGEVYLNMRLHRHYQPLVTEK